MTTGPHGHDPLLAEKLRALTLELTTNAPMKDPRAWASTIYNNFLGDCDGPNGKKVSYVQIEFACKALRINARDAFAQRERVREKAA